MNQVFSFKRYVWLLKRQWYENAAIYKWGIVLLVLVTGLLFGLGSLMFGKKGPVISITFIIVLFYIYFKLSIWFGISTHIDFPKNSIIIYFLPVWWVLMFFVMKKKEA